MSQLLKVYLENKDSLRRFLRRYFNRIQDIEDVSQEAFLRSFVANSRTKISSPRAFLFQTAKNLALNELTKKANSATDTVDDFSRIPMGDENHQFGPGEQYYAKQKLAAFTEAVSSLPPQCQKVFVYRKVEGLKVKEIAARLDISVSAVEKHIAKGLIKCEEYLKKMGYEPSEFGRSNTPENKKTDQSGTGRGSKKNGEEVGKSSGVKSDE